MTNELIALITAQRKEYRVSKGKDFHPEISDECKTEIRNLFLAVDKLKVKEPANPSYLYDFLVNVQARRVSKPSDLIYQAANAQRILTAVEYASYNPGNIWTE